MPIFKTNKESDAIASSMIEVVRMHMLESKADSKAAIGVALTEVFCKAMLELFPETAQDGRDILYHIIPAIMSFPDPRRKGGEVTVEEAFKNDNTN